MMPDHYEVLNVSRRASEKVIKSAFAVLAQEYQNDNARMKMLVEAYKTLKDKDLREKYDNPTSCPPTAKHPASSQAMLPVRWASGREPSFRSCRISNTKARRNTSTIRSVSASALSETGIATDIRCWLYDIGYRRMMMCDEICLDEKKLAAAMTAMQAFKGSYTES